MTKGKAMLHIYNTLTRKKEKFVPLKAGKVGMYVCGMTVYDYCHFGHARVMVVFDMVARWFRASAYDVNYVRNITDIDDKIIQRAKENGESIYALTERFIQAMHEDSLALGVLPPDHEPRATDYVDKMCHMIQQIEQHHIAYQADNGDVLFAVRKFPEYGRLSGKAIDDLRAGERVAIAQDKRDPLDFVLWKKAKEEESDECKWSSPWGLGRPGWHIECSTMSCDLLGEQFDIHGGGEDLQFPHHENEIAQSVSANQHNFVNYWMHNGFIQVNNEKMSKSLGNFFTIRDVLKQYDAEVIRFFILRAHYRSPLNYALDQLDDARQSLTRLYTALSRVKQSINPENIDWQDNYSSRFKSAMDDDFNTVEALAVLFELATEVNRSLSLERAVQLKSLAAILGLLEREPQQFLQSSASNQAELSSQYIETLIEQRALAKKNKAFAKADEIREQLLKEGVVLEDTAQGTSWRRQ